MFEGLLLEAVAALLAAQVVQIGFEARLLWLVGRMKSDVERNSELIDSSLIATDGGTDTEDT